MKNWLINFLLLLSTLSVIFIVDRLLLLHFGLPLWEWDSTLHYKHRPNITKYWDIYNKSPIKINAYGFHDDDFPVKKEKNELRILNIGDSITMGHGVTKDETYSKYLENFYRDSLYNYNFVQAINAGVQGYSTFQELEVLKRATKFEPDIVTIGFCLNDVTEPFVINKKFNGTGLDYHRVTQAPNKITSYFLNETGFGRLIQEIRIRILDAKQEKLSELFDVKTMIMNRENSTYKFQWEYTLNNLLKIYKFCEVNHYKPILLIFPFTFQLNNVDLQWPQGVLIEQARKNKVEFINFVNVFENILSDSTKKIEDYYLDENHFTPLGHQIVAKEILKLLNDNHYGS